MPMKMPYSKGSMGKMDRGGRMEGAKTDMEYQEKPMPKGGQVTDPPPKTMVKRRGTMRRK